MAAVLKGGPGEQMFRQHWKPGSDFHGSLCDLLVRVMMLAAADGLPDVPDRSAVPGKDKNDVPDHWARLGVPRTADTTMIKCVFKRLCALLHPDRPSNY